MSKIFDNFTKDELIKYINELRKQMNNEKFGLYFDRKIYPEEVSEFSKNNIPVLSRTPDLDIIRGIDENVLIEGENLHALIALNMVNTAEGLVDVIFIDPPYNTGAKDWLYNNDYVDSEDSYRHTKWLNMMEKRLILARDLLKDTGTIVVSIDHYELFQLGMLMNQIFGEDNKYGVITVVHKPEGRQFTKGLNPSNEFYMVYGKNRNVGSLFSVPLSTKKAAEFNLSDSKGNYRLEPYMRIKDGDKNNRENKPNNWFPVYVNPKTKVVKLTHSNDFIEVLPIYNGVDKSWSTGKELFQKNIDEDEVSFDVDDGVFTIYKKYREQESIKTHWIKKEYNATVFGTKELNNILGTTEFNFPKSIYAVIDALKITAHKEATVMDFFAGSGTTAQAVLDLNKEDGGNRKFILCTNNENNIMRDVCYPRIKTVITGIRNDHTHYSKGITTNVRFFEIDFISDGVSRDQSKYNLVEKCDSLLCLKEETFDRLKSQDRFNIYANLNRTKATAIFNDYFEENDFNQMLRYLVENKFQKCSVYYFSLDSNVDKTLESFVNGILPMADVKPIPSKIYEVYKKIADDLRRDY